MARDCECCCSSIGGGADVVFSDFIETCSNCQQQLLTCDDTGEGVEVAEPSYKPLQKTPVGAQDDMPIRVMKLEGQLGVFYDRKDTTRTPTPVELDFTAYRSAVSWVLTKVLEQQISQTRYRPDIVTDIVKQLTNGVAVMTYIRLRVVNYFDLHVKDRFSRKPMVPTPFEVPIPYSLAISELGLFKVSGLPKQEYYTPVVQPDAATNFGCPSEERWSPFSYSRVVEFAKTLGVRFCTVNLTDKRGTSWWFYRPDGEGDDFTLQCPFPKENFTETSAIIASLFCSNAEGGFYNPIFNLEPLGAMNFGTMLRHPPPTISVDTYNAVILQESDNYACNS